MNIASNIGFPLLFFILSVIWTVWFAIDFGKKKLSTKISINWLILNVFCLSLSTYLLVIGSINASPIKIDKAFNFINFLTEKFFGIRDDLAWVIWLIITITITSINISIKLAIKVSELNKKVDEMNRSLAITKGKLNIQLNDFNQSLNTAELSFEEYKKLLNDRLAKEKIKIKYENKINNLKNKQNNAHDENDINLNIKNLLGFEDNNDINKY